MDYIGSMLLQTDYGHSVKKTENKNVYLDVLS